MKVLREETLQQKEYMQRNNLIISGIPEEGYNENCVELVDNIFYNKLWVNVRNYIDKAD